MPHLCHPPQNSRHIRAAGFTLVELLTVVAIIGILAAILIPVVGNARAAARGSACVSNLKQIGVAFRLYAADNQGLFPALRVQNSYKGEPGTNPSGENWQMELSGYQARNLSNIAQSKADTDAYVFCPEFVSRYRNDPRWTGSVTAAGYGMNTNLGVSSPNIWKYRFRANLIPQPARTILVGESEDYTLDISSDWKPSDTKMTGYSSGDPVRHGNSSNYLFADGRVSKLSPDDALKAILNRPN